MGVRDVVFDKDEYFESDLPKTRNNIAQNKNTPPTMTEPHTKNPIKG